MYLIGTKLNEEKENGKKKTAKDIAVELGITEQALSLYQKNRLPEYKQLAFIRKYFDVPYSFLFGEISTEELKNIKLGINLGLNDDSISELQALQENKTDDSLDNNYDATIKLFLINYLINNDKFLNGLLELFSFRLGKKQLNERYNGKPFFTPLELDDDYYNMRLYTLINNISKDIESYMDSDKLLPSIKSLSEEKARKYSGKHQAIMKEIDTSSQK